MLILSAILSLPLLGNRCTQLWDPLKAAAAEARGEDIDGFLKQGALDHTSRMTLMEALHRSDYSVEKAVDEYIRLMRERRSCLPSRRDLETMGEMLENGKNKDFYAIADWIGCSVGAILVCYYEWKGRNIDGSYERCKKRWNNESDWCHVCQDGGQMIVCEHCHKAFHLHCLDPPLKRVPRGDWYCPGCMMSPAKLNRAAGTFPIQPSEVEEPEEPPTKKTLVFTDLNGAFLLDSAPSSAPPSAT